MTIIRSCRLLLATWAMAGLSLLGGLEPSDPFEFASPPVRRYGVEDGLPSGTVYSLTWDAHGVLWAATQDGAARFDGRTWTPVRPPGARSTLRTILKDQAGALWVGAEREGIWRLEGDRWTRFEPEAGINQIVETHAGATVLWACTRGQGLLRWDGAQWNPEGRGLGATWVWSLKEVVDLDGMARVYAMTRQGLWVLDGGQWLRVGRAHSFLDEVNGMEVGRDDQGRPVLWVGCWQRGLATFNGRRWTLEGPREGIPSLLPTTTLYFDDQAPGGPILWLGSYDRGLLWRQNGRWHTLEGISSVQVPGVYCILPGRYGKPSLWFGTRYGGIGALDLGGWYALDLPQTQPTGGVSALAEGSGKLWLGTAHGVIEMAGGRMRTHAAGQGAPSTLVNRLLAEPDGRGGERLWVSGTDGLHCLEGGRWNTAKVHGLSRAIPTFQVLRSRAPGVDRMFAATEKGVAVGEGGRWRWLEESHTQRYQEVYTLAETLDARGKATLWLGTRERGVLRYRDGHLSPMPISADPRQVNVNDLKTTRDSAGRTWLWAAFLGEGIGRLEVDREGAAWKVWSQVDLPGLPSPSVYNLTFSGDGALYTASSKGMARLQVKETPTGPELSAPIRFTEEDGLPSLAITYFGTLLDARGRIWVGSHRGVVVLDPKRETFLRELPPLRLDAVQVGGRSHPPQVGEVFSHDQGRFKAVALWPLSHRGGESRFRTQLVGLEGAPGPWVAEPWREFAGLPARHYELKVWARCFDGREVGPVSWAFQVAPAPWATGWAFLAYGLALAGAVTLVVRAWTERLQHQSRTLEQLVDERTRALAEALQNADSARVIAEFEREAATESRAEAERANQAKSAFLANMSHEIRTPLNAVLGFSEVLRKDATLGPRQRGHLDIVHRSGQALLRLINDILDLSKIEAGRVELEVAPFSLRDLLKDLHQLMSLRASEKGLVLDLTWAEGTPEGLLGDGAKLRQVLLNLLGNAVKFTQAGVITLSAGICPEDATTLCLGVSDTGPGMAPEEVARLFNPFEQTAAGRKSRQGTGLGLALSQRLAEAMGGRIEVRSELGVGSQFTVLLPRVETSEIPTSLGRRREPVGLGDMGFPVGILVADDHEPACELYRSLLTPMGFEVRTAEDGRAALRALDEALSRVVILDLQMPVMDGIETAREIRRRWGPEPVFLVACSASVLQEDRPRVLEAGFDAFLPKPFQVAEFLELLESRLGWPVRWAEPSLAESPTDAASGPVGCPTPLQEPFRQALLTGDVDQLSALVDQLHALAPEIGRRAHQKLQAFDFQGLSALLLPNLPRSTP